ncbi:nitroreductase family protein [Terrilactibacillus laevilacticus]|uniref:nitroreductase family protein n=1 Tax=Terrilactibacillus laevilacticus TaxID=1380157 RepID=UPI00114687B1|nr:nitroreductase family protein [Terrilactibacillus laevilacticus]
MNVFEAISKRREITQFLGKSIPSEILERVLNAAFLAPSGNNLPSREFILVTDREILKHLAKTTPYMPWLANAAAGIVITGCPNVSKYWIQDASIASGFIWLSAVELGLGAAFGAVFHAEDHIESNSREIHVKKTLEIPEDRRVLAIMGLGYPEKQPASKELIPKDEIIHYHKFNGEHNN